MGKQRKLESLEEAKKELLVLQQAKDVHTPHWSVTEICLHCAQTIDYAMTGYPVMKPAFVRNTIGKIAIKKFLRQGYMKHDLTAPVPGGAKLDTTITPDAAIEKLQKSIQAFQSAQEGTLKPHLLFGNLTKPEYDQYFAMHIADHLSEVDY